MHELVDHLRVSASSAAKAGRMACVWLVVDERDWTATYPAAWEGREAATVCLESLDEAMRELHAARELLVDQVRRFDDAYRSALGVVWERGAGR
jgi:hypothetical protein